jgi:glycosyltransferase involved in cell wall biosynthesis
MSDPKITVVLPCYHVEKYLPSIHSDLMAQTFQDFEIIYVNDGGGEISKLIHSFADNSDRVIAVDKENGGVGSARNVGIDKAHGEWIVFVDPDDRVEECYLQKLYDAVAGTNLVLGIGGFKLYNVAQGSWTNFFLESDGRDADLCDIYNAQSVQYAFVWNKIYKTSFLREHNIYFNDFSFAEDVNFNHRVYLLIDRVGVIKDCGYLYNKWDDSATYRYHANYKYCNSENVILKMELLKKFGKSEEDINRIYERILYRLSYNFVLNYFRKGSPLSFSQKRAKIEEEIFGDEKLMSTLQKCDLSARNRYNFCARLILKRNSWLIASVFTVLFCVKYNFTQLYYWFESHIVSPKVA